MEELRLTGYGRGQGTQRPAEDKDWFCIGPWVEGKDDLIGLPAEQDGIDPTLELGWSPLFTLRIQLDSEHPDFLDGSPYGVVSTGQGYGDSSILAVATDLNIVNDSSTVFIDLKPSKEDTLSCVFTQNNHVLTLAWYDGVQKMTAADQGNTFFTVREK